MKTTTKLAFAFVFGVLGVTAVFLSMWFGDTAERNHRDKLPPNYSLESDGKYWRYVRTNSQSIISYINPTNTIRVFFTVSGMYCDTKQEAIDLAWDIYMDQKGERVWKPVTP